MTRVLLTPEESDSVMPKLEEMFLNYQEKQGGMWCNMGEVMNEIIVHINMNQSAA